MNVKNVFILGDSYSTFKGYIPEGHSIYYSENDASHTGVVKVEDTWWYPLMNELCANLVLNDSWSGSTVCNTGYGGDCSKTSSFIFRLDRHIANGFFDENDVDTVFVFGGTNDAWANSPIGEIIYSDFTSEALFSALPAFSYVAKRLSEKLPNANVIFLINTEIKEEIRTAIREIATHYGHKYVDFESIDKVSGHPTVLGMKNIKDTVLKFIQNN